MLPWLKDVSIVIAGLVAFVTFWTGLIQYIKQGHQARAGQFIQMRRRFLEDVTFKRLLNMVATADPAVSQESIQDRRNLVGFLEEIGLMTNSGLIKPEVARYMFGYYVLLIDGSPDFWEGLDRDSEYWTVFHKFSRTIKDINSNRANSMPLRI